MSHAITIGGLLGACGIGAGLGLVIFGLLWIFADGMSDAPSENAGKGGCITLIIGVVLTIAALLAMFL